MSNLNNQYCMHSVGCGELRASNCGEEHTLTGWAWHNRDHGGLIFIDLRDRSGYCQIVVDPEIVSSEDFEIAEHVGREFVLLAHGKVRMRSEDTINPNMDTGEIEVLADRI